MTNVEYTLVAAAFVLSVLFSWQNSRLNAADHAGDWLATCIGSLLSTGFFLFVVFGETAGAIGWIEEGSVTSGQAAVVLLAAALGSPSGLFIAGYVAWKRKARRAA